MTRLEIGETVEVDLFGLQVAGTVTSDHRSLGKVVGLAPGTIIVQLQTREARLVEVTVGVGRIIRVLPASVREVA